MRLLKIAAFILATAVASVGLQNGLDRAKAAVWQWSTTAATNSTADPTINWSEGMSPSSVNDSARAMMAATAAWRNDLRALTVTTGTSTAYVLTSNQGGFVASSVGNGFMIGFLAHVANTGTATINVDGAGAKPLRSVSGNNLAPGILVATSLYTAVYRNSSDEWLLINIRGAGIEVPIGAVIDWTAGGAPGGGSWINPEGQCISQTTYSVYFGLVGFTYGGGCGPGLFQVPDYRGRVLAHNDNGAGRLSCSLLGCGASDHAMTPSEMPIHNHSFSGNTNANSPSAHNHNFNYNTAGNTNTFVKSGVDQAGIWSGSATPGGTTGTENSSLSHNHSFSGTTDNNGSGVAMTIVQPTSYSFKILRIL